MKKFNVNDVMSKKDLAEGIREVEKEIKEIRKANMKTKKKIVKKVNEFRSRKDVCVGEHNKNSKFFVVRERWVSDGTWWKITFAEKLSWANDRSDAIIRFRNKKEAELTAEKLNKIIGW